MRNKKNCQDSDFYLPKIWRIPFLNFLLLRLSASKAVPWTVPFAFVDPSIRMKKKIE